MVERPAAAAHRLTRRTFLAAPALIAAPSQTEVRIEEVRASFEDYLYRAPYLFGGKSVDRVTLLNSEVIIRARDGRTAKGFGSMPLGNVWAYPSKTLSYDDTLGAMKALALKMERITGAHREYGHPVDLNVALEPQYLRVAGEMPKLAVLVTASPFDAAIHDAYGKLLGRSTYQTYGRDAMRRDLGAYLGKEFRGEYLDKYIQDKPTERIHIYHSVGGADPILEEDLKTRLDDGLPNTLPEWIRYNGLTHLKIKLNGGDLAWDVERVVRVEHAAASVSSQPTYCLDFNENCPNVGYLLDFLRQIKQKVPGAFDRVQYVEQPTKRDLKADRANVMHEAAKLRPVVIDESLTDLESLLLAREMGYTGVAIKACKGQTQATLMAAAAQKFGMFLCVQDLTCPGASFVHSAGLAAHVPGITTIEANSRQYVPKANEAWAKRLPELFVIRDGTIGTGVLRGPGLSAVE
jgi:L-alanine-DL-glutamate epimerase-like enolase superfamily enzyme